MMCDECGDSYHINCLETPLTEVPKEEHWYNYFHLLFLTNLNFFKGIALTVKMIIQLLKKEKS